MVSKSVGQNGLTGSSLRKVINVTGTVIHTNLGRSVLSYDAISSIKQACSSYVNLEYDVASGHRGHRDRVTENLIKELTGCEASTVVNNMFLTFGPTTFGCGSSGFPIWPSIERKFTHLASPKQ